MMNVPTGDSNQTATVLSYKTNGATKVTMNQCELL